MAMAPSGEALRAQLENKICLDENAHHSHENSAPSNRPGSSGSYYDRISKLSERLSGLQQGLEHERNLRFDGLGVKMQDVDARLMASQESVNQECGALKEQLAKFHRDFDEERLSR